jgi:protein-S-isoprenylcysteine O-methyltransferase Ste14
MQWCLRPPTHFLILAALMAALHWYVPIASFVPHPANWIGLPLIVTGVGIAARHAGLFRRLGTNIYTFGEPGQLTTAALFSRTRNPMYLGMLTALLGWAIVLGSLSPLAGPVTFFALANFWYIPWEEQAMARKFGAEYAKYWQTVPRWW